MCPRYLGFLLIAIGGGSLMAVSLMLVALSPMFPVEVWLHTVSGWVVGSPLMLVLVGAFLLFRDKRNV